MDIETVEQIVALMADSPVTEITVEQQGRRISVRKPLGAAPHPAAYALGPSLAEAVSDSAHHASEETAETAAEEAHAAEPTLLTAPMVGIFHAADRPVRYEMVVTPGQVVGSIESMKLMNDIVADRGGQVVEVFVEDGAPVEYGQTLFRLAPR